MRLLFLLLLLLFPLDLGYAKSGRLRFKYSKLASLFKKTYKKAVKLKAPAKPKTTVDSSFDFKKAKKGKQLSGFKNNIRNMELPAVLKSDKNPAIVTQEKIKSNAEANMLELDTQKKLKVNSESDASREKVKANSKEEVNLKHGAGQGKAANTGKTNHNRPAKMTENVANRPSSADINGHLDSDSIPSKTTLYTELGSSKSKVEPNSNPKTTKKDNKIQKSPAVEKSDAKSTSESGFADYTNKNTRSDSRLSEKKSNIKSDSSGSNMLNSSANSKHEIASKKEKKYAKVDKNKKGGIKNPGTVKKNANMNSDLGPSKKKLNSDINSVPLEPKKESTSNTKNEVGHASEKKANDQKSVKKSGKIDNKSSLVNDIINLDSDPNPSKKRIEVEKSEKLNNNPHGSVLKKNVNLDSTQSKEKVKSASDIEIGSSDSKIESSSIPKDQLRQANEKRDGNLPSNLNRSKKKKKAKNTEKKSNTPILVEISRNLDSDSSLPEKKAKVEATERLGNEPNRVNENGNSDSTPSKKKVKPESDTALSPSDQKAETSSIPKDQSNQADEIERKEGNLRSNLSAFKKRVKERKTKKINNDNVPNLVEKSKNLDSDPSPPKKKIKVETTEKLGHKPIPVKENGNSPSKNNRKSGPDVQLGPSDSKIETSSIPKDQSSQADDKKERNSRSNLSPSKKKVKAKKTEKLNNAPSLVEESRNLDSDSNQPDREIKVETTKMLDNEPSRAKENGNSDSNLSKNSVKSESDTELGVSDTKIESITIPKVRSNQADEKEEGESRSNLSPSKNSKKQTKSDTTKTKKFSTSTNSDAWEIG